MLHHGWGWQAGVRGTFIHGWRWQSIPGSDPLLNKAAFCFEICQASIIEESEYQYNHSFGNIPPITAPIQQVETWL